MKTNILAITLILAFELTGLANNTPKEKFSIKGKIVDITTKKPLEYATIKLLSTKDSSMITGTISDINGNFTLKHNQAGNYLLSVNFMGYKTGYKSISLQSGQSNVDIEQIEIEPSSKQLAEVVVQANEYAVDYHIDKKVLHVSSQLTSSSGSAVDVLQNTPSVKVDVEGNVALRGNSNFTVLIDGRPTVLDSNEALQQIPASSIQDIEIITNPSAKFDPEGTAGIINIVTKKRSLEGVTGLVNANIGLDNKYGGDFLLNYRTEYFNYFIGLDYTSHTYPGTMESERRYYGTDTAFILSSGDRERQRENYSGRAGIEWFPTDKTVLSISTRVGGRGFNSKSNTDYTEWNSSENIVNNYKSIEDGGRSGNFYGIRTNFTQQFSTVDHKLDAQLLIFNRQGDEENVNTLTNPNGTKQSGQKSIESGPRKGARYRLDYAQPINEYLSYEGGFQGRYVLSSEVNEIYNYDVNTFEYNLLPLLSNDVKYLQNIHAIYSLGKGEFRGFGYQAGLRAEYTHREIELTETGTSYDIDRWDFFPTLHTSFKLSDEHQVIASYSRRINRPRGWYLEPFITWVDAYNVRQGNPGLKPEYINAYELGYQYSFGKNVLTGELYHRTTLNNIESIRRQYTEQDGVMIRTFENMGSDYSTGLELSLNTKPIKWWNIDITGDFYNYRVKGTLDNEVFDKNSFTYNVRLNNTFNIKDNTSIQLNPAYSSAEIEPQEREEGYFRIDGAIRQSFFNKSLQATLQMRNILGTARHESTTTASDLYYYRQHKYKSPIIMLNITWRINNFKNDKKQDIQNSIPGGGEM